MRVLRLQKWRSPRKRRDAVGGLARSKLPFWLYTMHGVKDPAALEGIVELLALARSLGRDGFTPTTLEALIEQPNRVEVLGRTGEDAVVAVGVGAQPIPGSIRSPTARLEPRRPAAESRS